MKSTPRSAVVVGAGLIGLALARELHRQGWRVTVLDAGEPPASWAGAGMLAAWQTTHPQLRPLAISGARLYPTWIAELERETYLSCGYRPGGTLVLQAASAGVDGWQAADCSQLELGLRLPAGLKAWLVERDHSVDNRALLAALRAAVRARGIPICTDCRVLAIEANAGACRAVALGRSFEADVVINAAGAWAGSMAAPIAIPVRPRKGQMLALQSSAITHVIEAPGVYLVPRADGRVLVGATLEDNGFAAGTDAAVLDELRQRAIALVPALASAPVVETWCGFRPCSSDELPILGPTRCPGYWVAAGHFRDGILLAPLTAKIIAKAMTVGHLTPALDLAPFSPSRFAAS